MFSDRAQRPVMEPRTHELRAGGKRENTGNYELETIEKLGRATEGEK